MNFRDVKYSQLIANIKNQYNSCNNWDKIRNFELDFMPGQSPEQIISTFCMVSGINPGELTVEIWNNLINYLENKDKKYKVTKLDNGILNDATLPNDPYSSWKLYEARLKSQNWSEDSIQNVEQSSFGILKNLSMNTIETGPVKGLVVGNVQSGKTANMAGVIAMAADNGFNYFIVLSGVIENLREQTANRLYSDLNKGGNSNLHWHQVSNPSLKSRLPEYNIENFNLSSNSKDKYFTVCLKNSSRLNSLVKWLYNNESKAKQLKILVIDDEADQASINTKKIESNERTAINKAILELVNSKKVKSMNYIAYTATPYANILNDTSKDSLYPRNFIALLEPSEDYIGPKQIFGAEEPETNPYIDIVRSIPDEEAKIIRESQVEYGTVPLANSLRDSIHWFILTVAAMRILDYRKPISMLVHTSFKIVEHEKLAMTIGEYLKYFKNNYREELPRLQELYENESLDFKRSHFLEGMREYSTKELVPDYPKWNEMEKYIERMIRLDEDEFISHIPIDEEGQAKYHKGFHLVIDNSKSQAEDQIVRLVYPKETQTTAPAFIVIGGNTLSRGLTLEGLTTTYFLRATNQADTLMQMGRWFGYRKNYEIFPRIWLDSKSLERYQFLSQMNEELREEIAEFAERGATTDEYGLRVKNSANYQFIRITSSNKMQSAESHEFDFTGFNSQTVYFENDIIKLEHNLEYTNKFLNGLSTPIVRNSNMIWKGISFEYVKQFLENYLVYESDIKMANLDVLVEWFTEKSANFADWNIVLSSVGKVEETKNLESNWMIHGYSPKPITRTKMKNRSSEKIASIGALRGPADLVADIDKELEESEKNISRISEIRKIRKKYGYDQVPLLTIFRIDKGQEERHVKGEREILNFPRDIIGINLMLPGFSKGNNTTYISAKVKVEDENNFTEETEYED